MAIWDFFKRPKVETEEKPNIFQSALERKESRLHKEIEALEREKNLKNLQTRFNQLKKERTKRIGNDFMDTGIKTNNKKGSTVNGVTRWNPSKPKFRIENSMLDGKPIKRKIL